MRAESVTRLHLAVMKRGKGGETEGRRDWEAAQRAVGPVMWARSSGKREVDSSGEEKAWKRLASVVELSTGSDMVSKVASEMLMSVVELSTGLEAAFGASRYQHSAWRYMNRGSAESFQHCN